MAAQPISPPDYSWGSVNYQFDRMASSARMQSCWRISTNSDHPDLIARTTRTAIDHLAVLLLLCAAACGVAFFVFGPAFGKIAPWLIWSLPIALAIWAVAALLWLLSLTRLPRQPLLCIEWAADPQPQSSLLFEVFRVARFPISRVRYVLKDTRGEVIAQLWTSPLLMPGKWFFADYRGRPALYLANPGLLATLRVAMAELVLIRARLLSGLPFAGRVEAWAARRGQRLFFVFRYADKSRNRPVGRLHVDAYAARATLHFDSGVVECRAYADRRALLAAALLILDRNWRHRLDSSRFRDILSIQK